MFESAIVTALMFGLLSAVSLPLGALVGIFWRPSNRIMAFLLAFGGGALLAALTIDLMAPGIKQGLFNAMALGAICGGLLFKLLDYLVNERGGYLRKPSTAINFWRTQTRKKTRQVLGSMKRVHSLKGLSNHSLDKLADIVSIREYPAGAYLFRKGDHPGFMYVIESGSVELCDPARGDRVFATLGSHDVFGRLSFFTGLHRKTDARIKTPARLMCIPRQAFFELLLHSGELRDYVVGQLYETEIKNYLEQHYLLNEADVIHWLEQAGEQLIRSGTLTPPVIYDPASQELPALLEHEKRLGFFREFSAHTLSLLAARMAKNAYPAGVVFFDRGELADRCFLLCRGTVFLIDAKNHSREPIVVKAGEMFGAYSFLTAGPHTMTAMSHDATEVWELRSEDFQELWLNSAEIRQNLSALLQRHQVEEYLTERQGIDPKRAALWLDKSAKSMASGEHFPSVGEIIRTVATQSGAPMAMYLGILLDGIPESLVIGGHVLVAEGMSMSLIGGLFLANLPEALSSSAGMKDQGFAPMRILAMWTSLMLMTGIGAGLGVALLQDAPHELVALIKGLAAGAMLTMIAETMLPEAFHNGGGIVGLSTLAGFLTAIFVNQI